jgi:hypothetical protein
LTRTPESVGRRQRVFKSTGGFDRVDQASRGRLELAEEKIAFVVSKSVFAGRDVFGGKR